MVDHISLGPPSCLEGIFSPILQMVKLGQTSGLHGKPRTEVELRPRSLTPIGLILPLRLLLKDSDFNFLMKGDLQGWVSQWDQLGLGGAVCCQGREKEAHWN